MTKQTEAMKLALEALDDRTSLMKWQIAREALREALAQERSSKEQPAQQRHISYVCPQCYWSLDEQPAQQEQGDSICQEDDGCPTEKAVLQRFWRGQSIPDEHYPAWFKPVQQEPVAKKKHEPKIDLGKYAGTYGGYITPEPSEGYLQKAYRLANELRSHLSIAPAQRTWVGLTDEEAEELWESTDSNDDWELMKRTEAKLKEKNT